jgi:hypothetical protein
MRRNTKPKIKQCVCRDEGERPARQGCVVSFEPATA